MSYLDAKNISSLSINEQNISVFQLDLQVLFIHNNFIQRYIKSCVRWYKKKEASSITVYFQ